MTKEDIKLKTEHLLKEISIKTTLSDVECIDIALLIVDKVLTEQPTYTYWNIHDDEIPSAVTVWNEVKSKLENIKLKRNI